MTKRIVYDPTVTGRECDAARRSKAASEITVMRPNADGELVAVGVIPPPGQWPEGGKPKMNGVPQEPNQRKAKAATRKQVIHADVEKRPQKRGEASKKFNRNPW